MNEIHFIGYDSMHDSNFYYESMPQSDCFLLLLIHTPAYIEISGKTELYPANTAVLYAPENRIHYSAAGETYSDSWIRFSTDEAYAVSFPMIGQPFSVVEPEYINHLIRLITWETSSYVNSPRYYQHSGIDFFSSFDKSEGALSTRKSVIDDLMRILFMKLNESVLNKSTSLHETELMKLRIKIANNPQLSWNIADLSKELNLSQGHFQALYKEQFNISCMDDIINLRLKKAEDHLLFSTESIAEIAEHCGYNSHEHFSRQFKSHYNMTPGEFRKKSRGSSVNITTG